MDENEKIPKILWIAIISLAIFSIIHFFIGLIKPIQFIALVTNVLLIIGILRLARWAYFLSIAASLIGPIILLTENSFYFYIILLLNLTLLLPVLICTKSFFPDKVKPDKVKLDIIK